MPNIIDAIQDPRFIADSLSPAQEAALRALYGLPLDDDQVEIFCRATGFAAYEPREYRESTIICGRRSGKSSRLAANCAIYEAAFRTYHLDRGERGYVVVIAPTKRQAGIVFSYILSRLEHSPALRAMIAGDPRQDEVDLTNGVTVAVWPCSFRSIRGISIICAIADEVAFWYDDISGSNPASEVLRAIRPAMATFSNAKLIKISSPFAKSGVVWDDWRDREQHPGMLVWKLGTREMNPSLDADFLAAEETRDPEFFAREYGAEFYESASAFLPADAVEICIVRHRFELLPQPDVLYTASLDAAFRGDNFAFSIVHGAGENVIQDLIRSWRGTKSKPVNLAETLTEIVGNLKRFGISKIYGDQFCSEPIRQALAKDGVTFEQITTLGTKAAALWNTLRTLVTSGKIELLDDPETIAELKKLELIVTSGGNQRVEASTGHDDRAVALALAAHQTVARPTREPWLEVIQLNGQSSSREDGPARWWRPL